ncbi:MAG TPA: 2Fe-2S iron-sulfur cluster-binding protein [Anaeromyxobacteraceae bacterium]|nr:2Fe-2S iron-sulfur cluster-binding protein [Anaeromyxobacteraceae bacterium]
MPRVTFLPAGRSAAVRPGATLLEAAGECGADLPHNCGGVCACTTCHVWVESGQASLSPIEEAEDDRLDEAAGLGPTSRLACQARVGEVDVVVRIPGNRIGA